MRRHGITNRTQEDCTGKFVHFGCSSEVCKYVFFADDDQACARCKRRKIRCDGNTPKCANCAKGDDECIYAAEVKRRGVGKR